MRTSTARRRLPALPRSPLLLLLPFLLVPLPEFKVYVEGVVVEGGPGKPEPCLAEVTGIDIPDEVQDCNGATWCATVVVHEMSQAFCPEID